MRAVTADINKVILTGTVGTDPVLKYHPAAGSTTRFILVTAEFRPKVDGGEGIETVKHRIVMYGAEAERCRDYLVAGDRIAIEGRSKTRLIKVDGRNRIFVTEIIGDHMEVVG